MSDRTVRVGLAMQVTGFIQDAERAQRAVRKTGDAAQEAAAKFEQQKQAMNQAGIALTAMGAVAVAATALAVRSAINWESAWAGVTKTVDGTGEEMAQLEGDLRSLARTLPATHQEIAAVAEAAGQLGVAREDVAAFTRTMIDLSETTNLTADEAATSIAQLMNIMQTAPENVGRLGATLVALGNDGASTEREIVQMAQRIAGAGALVGATEGEVLGLANALASMGVTAELGGGVASRILQDLYSAVATGGETLEGFAKIAGTTAEDFAKSFRDDPVRALDSFAKGLNGVEASGGNVVQTLSDLGFRSTEEQRVLLQLKNSGDLLAKSLDLQADAWDRNSDLTEEAQKRYETTAAKLQILSNKANDAAITYGSAFLPAISNVTEAIGGMLDAYSDLPEGVQQQIAILTALAAVVALAGGAFLLAVPKIVEFGVALSALRDSQLPGVARAAGIVTTGIGRAQSALAKTAAFLTGPWGLAIVAATAGIDLLRKGLESLQASSEEMNNALVTAKSGMDILDTLSKGREWTTWQDLRKEFQDLDAVLALIEKRQDLLQRLPIIGEGTRGAGAEVALNDLGKQLRTLAEQDMPAAQRAFQLLAEETDGSDERLRQLLRSMPEFQAALTDQASVLGIRIDALSEDERIQALLAIAMDKTTSATEASVAATMSATEAAKQLTDAELERIQALGDADAGFVSFSGALTSVQEKQREWAEQTAADTDSSEDSWQDYYDGVSVNIDDFLADLQRQIDAQSAWEQNMILLSSRASQGVIDELAAMGTEGAPLVAELVNASDEQLAVLERAFGERSQAGTDAFAQNLHSAGPIIAAAGAQLGADTAAEIAQKLASGTATVDQIMQQYKLKVESYKPVADVEASFAERKMRGFFQQFDGRRINVIVDATGGETYRIAGTNVQFRAGGGEIYGPGGPREDRVPVMASPGEFMINAESYRKNKALVHAINDDRMPRYAGGGAIGFQQPRYEPSTTVVVRDSGVAAAQPRIERVTETTNLVVDGRVLANSLREYDRIYGR